MRGFQIIKFHGDTYAFNKNGSGWTRIRNQGDAQYPGTMIYNEELIKELNKQRALDEL